LCYDGFHRHRASCQTDLLPVMPRWMPVHAGFLFGAPTVQSKRRRRPRDPDSKFPAYRVWSVSKTPRLVRRQADFAPVMVSGQVKSGRASRGYCAAPYAALRACPLRGLALDGPTFVPRSPAFDRPAGYGYGITAEPLKSQRRACRGEDLQGRCLTITVRPETRRRFWANLRCAGFCPGGRDGRPPALGWSSEQVYLESDVLDSGDSRIQGLEETPLL
jgi:hypothetical protein